MKIGGWGDPHFYIQKLNSVNGSNRMIARFLSRWTDNKTFQGTTDKELRFLDAETTTDSIKVFYTKGIISRNRQVIRNIRVVHNNNTTTVSVNDNAAVNRIVAGPMTIAILRRGSGENRYFNFEITWGTINNLTKFGGAVSLILRRAAAARNGFWNGGAGRTWDGIGNAGQSYGISRSYFETTAASMLGANVESADLIKTQNVIINYDEFLTPEDSTQIDIEIDKLSESSYIDGIDPADLDSESASDLQETVDNYGGISDEVNDQLQLPVPTATPAPPPYPAFVSKNQNSNWSF
jgi:hypothetical protein